MQNINYDAIVKNAAVIRGKCGGAKLCAVVKCDAYGHGLERTARYLRDQVHCFAVGNVSEANVIAHLGKDILILLPSDRRNSVTAVKYGYILTADSFVSLKNALYAAQICGVPARVHLKIDSGMHRLGFLPEELPAVADFLIKSGGKAAVEGIYSHFSSSDCDAVYTEKQFAAFLAACEFLERTLKIRPVRHIANTAALFADSRYALDMVRAGLGLYGYGDEGLTPAKTVYANVISVKNLRKGDSVSYGNTFTAEKDMTAAVIDVGYACGLPRSLSSKAHFLCKGKRVPVAGAVCMAMCVADVTGLDVSPFDKVTVLGPGIDPSENSGSVIIYELLCNLR